jgi:superfamily II DNA or RNA helicase
MQWPVLLAVGTEVLQGHGHPAVRDLHYWVTPDERALRADARALLRDLGAVPPQPWSDSLPSLHARLLTHVTDTAEQHATRLWAVLDRIENAPANDRQRDLLRRTLADVASQSRPCLLIAPTIVDAVYTADQLTAVTSKPIVVIDATLSASERRSALARLAPGECVVTTPVLDDLWDELPIGCVVVILPFPPASGLPGRILNAAADIPGLDVIQLSEVQ